MLKNYSLFIILLVVLLLTNWAMMAEAQIDPVVKAEQLKILAKDLRLLKSVIANREAQSSNPAHDEELHKLVHKYNKAKGRFLAQASLLNAEETEAPASHLKSKRDFIEELQGLLLPMIDGLQRVSARPRKIENMRREREVAQEKINTLSMGQKNIKDLLATATDEDVQVELQEAHDTLGVQISDLRFVIDDIDRGLELELAKGKSVVEASSDLLRGFFGNRGKNLLFSLLTFLIIGWLMFRLRVMGFPERLIVSKRLEWMKRPLTFLYNIITFVSAFLGSMLCLYFLNDWLLVTFFTLILLSIIWSLKQVAPKFLKEARFVLNLGTVKEKERLLWKGIPWKVESLGLYSTLVNEELQGGEIRVAAKDLLSEYSRLYDQNEPWFPTHQGDWVEVAADKVQGEVILQTPEQVILRTRQGTHIFYASAEFLKLRPKTFAKGFLLEGHFLLAFTHAEKMDWILQELANECKKALSLPSLQFTVTEMAAYGIKLYASAHCSGHQARDQFQMECLLHETFIKFCHHHHLTFPQVIATVSNHKS